MLYCIKKKIRMYLGNQTDSCNFCQRFYLKIKNVRKGRQSLSLNLHWFSLKKQTLYLTFKVSLIRDAKELQWGFQKHLKTRYLICFYTGLAIVSPRSVCKTQGFSLWKWLFLSFKQITIQISGNRHSAMLGKNKMCLRNGLERKMLFSRKPAWHCVVPNSSVVLRTICHV